LTVFLVIPHQFRFQAQFGEALKDWQAAAFLAVDHEILSLQGNQRVLLPPIASPKPENNLRTKPPKYRAE
jgi:hypothetical protein